MDFLEIMHVDRVLILMFMFIPVQVPIFVENKQVCYKVFKVNKVSQDLNHLSQLIVDYMDVQQQLQMYRQLQFVQQS